MPTMSEFDQREWEWLQRKLKGQEAMVMPFGKDEIQIATPEGNIILNKSGEWFYKD